MNYNLLFVTFFFIILNVTRCQQNKPSFRILAPQVICKNKKDGAAETPSQITISMQTEGGQKLTYRVQMYFEVLGGYRGQQHALSLWRAVRMMEKKINTNDKTMISDKNQINVNNTELVQGVYYVFTIIGIDENGKESESQNFTVAYSDGKIKRTNADGSIIPDDITFLMLGSEVAYANLEYKVEANVKFCTPRYDYYFQWEVSNLPERYKNIIRIPGSTLRVPYGVFSGGQSYTISAKLIQSNDSKILLSDSIDVTVKKKGFSAKLIPENIIIGISRPLNLRLLLTDFDNSGLQPIINWMCKESTGAYDCDKMEDISEYQQSLEIYAQGLYTVSASVQIDTSETAVSNIIVDPDVIIVPMFKNPPTKDIQAGERFEMETTLDGLIPNCFAYWSVVNETGYEFFDIFSIPGGLGNISIADIEGNFLSELVDFVNSTLSRDILLIVPSKGEFPNWDGLKSNAKYKFRLIMTCPAPISNDINQTQAEIRRNVTSYADISIKTNQPPIGKTLEVTPQSGIGLKTIFKFSTGVAVDDNDDYPLKYNFQIAFDGQKISIGEYYENMVTTSQLPFSESNITTMYEVCDSREACSIVDGPVISTTMPSETHIDLNDIISNIKASMSRMEYDQAFGTALIAGSTLKNHELSTSFRNNFTKIVRNEINRLLENLTSYYVSSSEIVKFVILSKQSSSIMNEDDNINQGLLELLESTDNFNHNNENSENVSSKAVQAQKLLKSSRKKRFIPEIIKRRDASEMDSKTDVFLQVFQSQIESKNESTSIETKKRLLEKVKSFVTTLCKDSSRTHTIINKSIINFEVRSTNMKQIIQTNLTMPCEPSKRPAYVKINANLNVNPKHDFCVGKIMFPSDYLSGQKNTDEIYELLIVEKINSGKTNIVDISDGSGEESIFLSIPIKKEFGNFECQIWENEVWSSNICITSSVKNGYVYCRCHKITIFRAVETMNATMDLTTIAAVVSETTPNSTGQIIMNVTEILESTTEVNNNTSVIEKVIEVVTTTANAMVTSLIQTMNETIPTTPMSVTYSDSLPTSVTNMNVDNNTNSVNVTSGSDILEIVTLSPVNDTSAIITTIATALTSPTAETITESTKLAQNTTLSSTTTSNFSESVLSTILSTIDSNSSSLQKDTLTANESEKRLYSATTGYALAVIFVIAGIFIIVALFVYNRRKKPNTLVQQLEIISSEIRTSNNAVKYARFHDEETMRGDNIETIFTAQ